MGPLLLGDSRHNRGAIASDRQLQRSPAWMPGTRWITGSHPEHPASPSARPLAHKLGAHVLQQPRHRRVVGGDQRGEAADAFLAATVRQLGQQFGAQAPALPVVDDGDGDLGGLGSSASRT